MIKQSIIRAFMLCTLVVPSLNRAMEKQKEENNTDWSIEEELKGGPQPLRDDAQEKPTFAQMCVEESLRAAPWAIPVAVASYYTLPSVIAPVVNYVKENPAHIAKTAALMTWNGFMYYNLAQLWKERHKGNPHPDKRSSKGWLCLSPILNAVVMTAVTDSRVAWSTAWAIAAVSLPIVHVEHLKDTNDRRTLQNFGYLSASVKTDTEVLKTQTKSINFCGEPAYTNILLSRQAELIRKATAFKENYAQLSKLNWISPKDKNRCNDIIVEYERVINNEYCPINNRVVSSDLS